MATPTIFSFFSLMPSNTLKSTKSYTSNLIFILTSFTFESTKQNRKGKIIKKGNLLKCFIDATSYVFAFIKFQREPIRYQDRKVCRFEPITGLLVLTYRQNFERKTIYITVNRTAQTALCKCICYGRACLP